MEKKLIWLQFLVLWNINMTVTHNIVINKCDLINQYKLKSSFYEDWFF